MNEYFKPWRRKFGLLFLTTACAFAVGWLRSSYFHDEVRFEGAQFTASFSSHIGRLYLMKVSLHRAENFPFLKRFKLQNTRLSFAQVWKEEDLGSTWRWQILGIGVQDFKRIDGKVYYSFFVAPYGFVVVPLTLISAWLLLSKPRRVNSKSVISPATEVPE